MTAPPPLPTTYPTDRISLRLRRSQRSGLLGGKPIFALDARADVASEARGLIAKYQLGSLVVYDSATRKQSQEQAYAHFSDASTSRGLASSLWSNARGLASAAMTALSLRITVDKLLAGQHIECKDLNELLGAELAIIEACRNLRTYLDTALTFDGREDLIEF